MKRVAIGAVLVLALAAGGCGGGGTKTLSKQEYGAQLNAICTDLNAKQKEIGTPNSISELADKGQKLLDEFDKALAKAKELKPSDEIKDQASKFISLAEQERVLLSDLIDAAKKNDITKVQQIGATIQPLDKESNDIATNQLGAPACAQG